MECVEGKVKASFERFKPVSVAEFRQHLKRYLELGEPLIVARRGKEPLGIFIPLRSRTERERAWRQVEARLAALDRFLAEHDVRFSEEELDELART